jgi:hypothetical protein
MRRQSGCDGVMAARTKDIAEFAVFAAEAPGGGVALKAAHTLDPAFDAAVILLETIVQVGVHLMPDGLSQHAADCPGIGAMTIGGHPLRSKSHGRLC